MTTKNQNYIVISLGGSLIVPGEIDTRFLRDFKTLLETFTKRGLSFVLVVGGGKTCRFYQAALSEIDTPTSSDLDWVGIYTTRLNAEFVRVLLGDMAHGEIITDPEATFHAERPVVVGAGWKPGWSTDYVATMLGKNLGAKKIANLSNIDYVYDKDPRKFPDAKKIEKISWAEYRKLIPEDWDPGMNTPFDPMASKVAEEAGLELAIMNGKNLGQLAAYLDGEAFTGTIIS